MSHATVNGVNLHYWRVGQGPDVVMLHGLIGNLAVWHLRIVPLLQREFRLTTYDLRGHGRSEITPDGYTTLDMASDLLGLIDMLEIERIFLVGHSFGADVALHFTLLYPERVERLVLLEPGLAALVHQRNHDDWEGWRYWVSKLEEVGVEVPPDKRSDFHYLLNLSLATPKFYGPARSFPRKRESLQRLINETTLVKDYEAVNGMTLERIATVQTPTLMVYGDRSHFIGTFHTLSEVLPNCQTLLLPGGEHFGPLEQPEQLADQMRAFFSIDSGQQYRQLRKSHA